MSADASSSTSMSFVEISGRVVVGFVLARVVYHVVQWLVNYVSLSRKKIWNPSPNNWAVVTGGTDGIGLAYCKHLASIGYPLLIISRNQDKLNAVKQSLEQDIANCPEIRTIAFDFSQNDDEKYDRLEEAVTALDRVDVLVNNVGVSFKNADYFTVIASTSPELLPSMINVNVVSAVKMTKMVWNRMIEDNRGVVLNIGSLSALSPVPLLALYSATKAFVDYFSQSLSLEAQSKPGVIVQSVLPGFVSTKMSHLRPSIRVPTADTYVSNAMKRVGHSQRTYGYWCHSMLGIIYELAAHFFGANFNSQLAFSELLKLRKRYYRIKKMTDPFQDQGENR